MTVPLYIFDLDGTLADIEHRRYLVEGMPKKWREFYQRCVHDKPNIPVIRTAVGLAVAGAEIAVWSGRSDEVQRETEAWLNYHLRVHKSLRMRSADDFQPDVQLKRSWLHSMSERDRGRLVAVFDDRQGMVNMWRDEGVPCFQVAPGDF